MKIESDQVNFQKEFGCFYCQSSYLSMTQSMK